MKVELKPQAIKDLQSIHKKDAARIVARLGELEGGLTEDIKRLTSFTPEYRLRVGNYRVLFEVEGGTVIIGLDHRSGQRAAVAARGPHSGPYGSWARRRVRCADRSRAAGTTINALLSIV